MKVNTRGFVRLVDAVGGVDFNVPVNMNYEDPTQDLYIHFSKGMQWLSGSDALKVARCRQNSYFDEASGKWKTYDAYSNADIDVPRPAGPADGGAEEGPVPAPEAAHLL